MVAMRLLGTTLVLMLLTLLASRAWSGEPKPRSAIDPAEVARLLLSDEEPERARGTRLLQERLRRGGDVQVFLDELAKEQAAWANDEDRWIARWIRQAASGTPEERRRALRLLTAMGPEALQRLRQSELAPTVDPQPARPNPPTAQPVRPVPEAAQAAPPAPASQQPAPASQQPAPASQQPAPRPSVHLTWTLLEVPTGEVETWLESDGGQHGPDINLYPVRRGDTVVLRGGAHSMLGRAANLPEARGRRRPSQVVLEGRTTADLLPGEAVPYRSTVQRTKGAWVVRTAELRRGLRVTAQVVPEGDAFVLTLDVRYTEIPVPMPVERVRPAQDVEPVELDRPEWRCAAVEIREVVTRGGEGLVVFVPGIVPDKVVVLGVRLLPTRLHPVK